MKKFFQGLKLKRGESILSDRERVSEGSEDEEDYGEQEEYEQSNVFSNDDEIYECSSDEFTSDYEASPACESEQDTYLNRDEIAFISEQVTRNLHEPQKHNPCDSDGAAVFSVESYELLDEQPTNQCQRVECTENSDDEVLQLRCEAGVSSQMPPPLPAELPKKTSKFRSLPRTPSSSSNSSKILSRPLPRIPKLSENGQDLYESGDKTDKEPEIPKTKPALPTREDILDTNTKKNILSKTPKPARPITPVKLAKKAVTSTAPSHIKPKPKLLHGNNITKPTENEVKAISPALPSKAKKKLTIKIKPENEKRSHLEAQKSFTENDKKTTEVPRSAEETDPTNKNKKIFHKNLANRINKIEPSAKKLNNEIANSIFVKLDQQKREASEGKPLKLPVHSPKTSHHSNSEKPSVPTKKPLKDINLSSKIKNPPKPPAHSGDGLIQKQNVSGCLSRSVSTSEQNNNETRLKRAVSKVAEKSKKMLSKNENGKSSEKSLPLNKEHKSEEVDETTQNYLDAPWFFGEITREEACNKLKNYGKQGAFLIRKRQENSAEIPFSLSIYNGVRVMNLQIRVKEEGKLAIGFEKPDEKTFADLQDIVFFYSTNLLEIKGKRHENILLSCSPQK